MPSRGMCTSPLAACALALALLVGSAHCRTLLQGGGTQVRWCIPEAANAALVASCTAAVAGANTQGVTFSCVAGGSEEACLEAIRNRTADLLTLGAASGARGMLKANDEFGLQPIVAEFYGALTGANYYSVALVDASFCTAGVTLASLKGKRACHTGYRRTAGWTLPIGLLAEENIMPAVNSNANVNADAESAAAFFSAVCAAGDTGALTSGGKWDGVCSACKGDCTAQDPYFDYPGAVRCLMEGAGDVAFTKHSTPLEVARDGSSPEAWATKNKGDLRLLCPSGGCKTLEEFQSCNIATAPAYAVMTRADFRSSAGGQAAREALVAAGRNATWLASVKNLGGIEGFPFSEDTESLLGIEADFDQYFGPGTRAGYEGIQKLDATPQTASGSGTAPTTAAPSAPATTSGGSAATTMRWCVPFAADNAFLQTCTTAVARGNTNGVSFTCVAGGSNEACLDLISRGGADLLLLGGTEQVPANEKYGLEPIVAEFYGDLQGASYYSVAVVNKEFCTDGVTLANLKGKRSCHTGYRRTAGWTLPVGYLVQEGVIPRVDGNDGVQADAESVASFFSAVCAAGTNAAGPMLGGGAWSGMCTGCKGDCSSNDPFFDYDGTLRCLMEGADVAFTKHTTVLEVPTDGSAPAPWATKKKDDLRLLCPSGGCATVDQYERCNIAKSPARAVFSRKDMQNSDMGKAVKDALVAGGSGLVDALTNIGGRENFIFGETAQGLLPVEVPFLQYYGANTKASYDGITSLDALSNSLTGNAAAPSSGGSSGVSSGAAAGIGIGCAVAGVLLGALGMMMFAKRKGGWQRHNDALSATGAGSEAYKL
ncbi:hypothetical protein COHA_009895 [Chlorella ohadii]|uniref:Transferrin-like domain-containing protein n=1 Tax=Chlorella ohadii TaxID=2649997 RepID=A0AAD5DHD4_9CHLO|nr:hypothetical protein COHA_009895 [Chlorella ohadii]